MFKHTKSPAPVTIPAGGFCYTSGLFMLAKRVQNGYDAADHENKQERPYLKRINLHHVYHLFRCSGANGLYGYSQILPGFHAD